MFTSQDGSISSGSRSCGWVRFAGRAALLLVADEQRCKVEAIGAIETRTKQIRTPDQLVETP